MSPEKPPEPKPAPPEKKDVDHPAIKSDRLPGDPTTDPPPPKPKPEPKPKKDDED